MTEMRIGDLAEQLGLNPQTIRYYESIGVLPEPRRTGAGHRIYETEDAGRLRFVRTAQRLGLALDEIREILRFRDEGDRPCPYVLGVLARQGQELDRRIAEMQDLRDQLARIQETADRLPGEAATFCPVIEHADKVTGRTPSRA